MAAQYKTLVPLERYDQDEFGVTKRGPDGKRLKIEIPAGTIVEIDGLALADLGNAVPDNEEAKAECTKAGLTDAVIARKVRERQKMEKALKNDTFAELQANQQQ